MFKAYQLKDVIRQYIDETNNIITYKSKTKKQIIDIILKNNIQIDKYEILQKNPTPRYTQNVLRKFNTKFYNEDEQQKYINEESKNTKIALKAQKKYVNREGTEEYLELQEHQVKFIKQFVYSNLQGSIAFHGVGSGKTLTAIVSSYWYLRLYPQNKVIVISPSALLFNFIQGMKQYGLTIEDNRYVFTTYDKYIRKPNIAKNALLIVDEAHNLRTQMNIQETYDPDTNELLDKQSNTNQRGFKIWKFGAMYAHKIILLTGTAFVNTIYDIENLLSMIDQREPITSETFKQVLSSPSNIKDYFSHRISYYKSPKSDSFPERREQIIPLYMTDEMAQKYDEIEKEGRPNSTSEKPNSFYCAEKYASNMIKGEGKMNPKIKWCLDTIKNSKQKFIIYSGLYETGIRQLQKVLNQSKIKYMQITGNESANAKEQSKLYFNGYNFDDDNFFNIKQTDPNFKYINNEYRVLLISRAGAEGVDTTNCQNLIILDHQWNDATSEQIIARAIRFKSHHGLPKNERYVNVYRLLLCFQNEKSVIEKIQTGNIDYAKMRGEIKENVQMELKLNKIENEDYLPKVKELKELKYPNGNRYIPDVTKWIKQKGAIGKKSTMVIEGGVEGWDAYNRLTTDQKRKEWRIQTYCKWYTSYGPEKDKIHVSQFNSIDVHLFILSKSKQATIDSFIEYFGNDISLFESYESALLKHVIEAENITKKKLTDEEQAHIYATLLKNEKANLKQLLISNISSKNRTTQQKLQQYFTNDKLALDMITKSDIKDDNEHIDILEPTAGDGQIIKQLCKLSNKDFNIDMCEIDEKNRNELHKLCNNAKNILSLLNHKNFLTFIPTKRYDYIYMNPPFHIKKSTNALLLHDVFDFDFVKRAFAMLKVGGKVIAITSKHWTFTKDMTEWTYDKDVTHEIKKNEKFGTIKMDIVLLKLIKRNEDEDDKILNTKFYRTNKIGDTVLNGEATVHDVKENNQLEKPLIVEKIETIIKEPELKKKKGRITIVKQKMKTTNDTKKRNNI